MNYWLATADPAHVEKLSSLGLFSGIVTNPDALAAAGRPPLEVFAALCRVSPGRVYAMLREADLAAMQAEADALLAIDPIRIGLKIAPTPNGLRLIRWLKARNATTDLMLTCIATTSQLALAAGVGARWVTPWGSLRAKHGGPSRDDVLDELQSCLAVLRARTELIVGAATAEQVGRLALRGIRHCFVWDRDVPAVVEEPWAERALATFAPAYAKIDAATGAAASGTKSPSKPTSGTPSAGY